MIYKKKHIKTRKLKFKEGDRVDYRGNLFCIIEIDYSDKEYPYKVVRNDDDDVILAWVEEQSLTLVHKEETTLLDRLIKAGLKDTEFYKEFEQKEKEKTIANELKRNIESNLDSNGNININYCIHLVREIIKKTYKNARFKI